VIEISDLNLTDLNRPTLLSVCTVDADTA